AEVDLNCLLWHLENTLAKSSKLQNMAEKEDYYSGRAVNRRQLINKYFWDQNSGIYKDYHTKKNTTTSSEHIAALYPLFLGLASPEQAKSVSEHIEQKFLFREDW
ncbi:MAG: trehalase family glycosidase, partial [Chryseobacterium taeanense]